MLVLSRRKHEKLVFPALGVTLEILGVKGNSARIGIAAPPYLRVLREELADKGDEPATLDFSSLDMPPGRERAHWIRNKLHGAMVALHLLRRQLERGLVAEADRTFQQTVELLVALENVAASRDAAEGHNPVSSTPQPSPESARSCRALLVEDDRNEAELLAGFLRLSGFEVATSGDGCDALDYLSTHQPPDVLLLDMFMPRCDGPKTVEAVRQNPQYNGMKVIAISGTSPELLGVSTGPRGVDRWFSKPLNPEILVRELSREMEGKCRCETHT